MGRQSFLPTLVLFNHAFTLQIREQFRGQLKEGNQGTLGISGRGRGDGKKEAQAQRITFFLFQV